MPLKKRELVAVASASGVFRSDGELQVVARGCEDADVVVMRLACTESTVGRTDRKETDSLLAQNSNKKRKKTR